MLGFAALGVLFWLLVGIYIVVVFALYRRPAIFFMMLYYIPSFVAALLAFASRTLEGDVVRRWKVIAWDAVTLGMSVFAIGVVLYALVDWSAYNWECGLGLGTFDAIEVAICEHRWLAVINFFLAVAALTNSVLTAALAVQSAWTMAALSRTARCA